jgi:hypothetical protein
MTKQIEVLKKEMKTIKGEEFENQDYQKEKKFIKVDFISLYLFGLCCLAIGGLITGFSQDLRNGHCIIRDFDKPIITNSSSDKYVWVIPTREMADSFCQSKGYDWGTTDSLLCNDMIKCFKVNLDGSYKVDCISVK